jgi:hypothetical protein
MLRASGIERVIAGSDRQRAVGASRTVHGPLAPVTGAARLWYLSWPSTNVAAGLSPPQESTKSPTSGERTSLCQRSISFS